MRPYRETRFVIPAPDGASIHGCFDQASDSGCSRDLVIFSHGLTGNPNEYLLKQGQRYFSEAGYDVARFSYYAAEPGARRLKNCTLRVHAEDLNTVCDHFRGGYRDLHVIGHSYGGLALLFARPPARAYAFWDSSFLPYESLWRPGAEFSEALGCYLLHWASDHVIGTAMVEEARALSEEKARALAGAIRAPSLVAIAGMTTERIPPGGLFDALTCEKAQRGFPAADHGFAAGETIFELLDATHQWFRRAGAG